MDKEECWKQFVQTGSIFDYLFYRGMDQGYSQMDTTLNKRAGEAIHERSSESYRNDTVGDAYR
ncbi:MAG TPA: hypothetical protein IAC41_05555 [Candidatus Merdenecus merdavium]|nr:hypothetical protein [Candidatus Merdenecus merdavium]